MEKARMEQEMRIAAEIQQALLPEGGASRARSSSAAAASLPCRSIGGDFYDYVDLPTGAFGFALGDVAGKGPPAALLSAMMQGMFAAQAATSDSPSQTIARVNIALYRRGIESRFVTLMYGALQPDGRLTYCNAGHNPPLVIRRRADCPAASNAAGRSSACSRAPTYDEETVTLDDRRLADRLQRRRVRSDVADRRGIRRRAHRRTCVESNLALGAAATCSRRCSPTCASSPAAPRRATTSPRWCSGTGLDRPVAR